MGDSNTFVFNLKRLSILKSVQDPETPRCNDNAEMPQDLPTKVFFCPETIKNHLKQALSLSIRKKLI
jgi:hypothetical protein